MNDSGQVVGDSYTAGGDLQPFSWTKQGGMVDLGTLGGTVSAAVAVNDRGQVVGYSSDTLGNFEPHAFSWTQQSGIVDLGTLVGFTYSFADAVNNSGGLTVWLSARRL